MQDQPQAVPPAIQSTNGIWVTQSTELPFQVVYVYSSANAAGDKVYCANLDAQALGAWPIVLAADEQSFKLWLRPGGPNGGPPNNFQGALCPAAFPSVSPSDAELPTSAPPVLEFSLADDGLVTTLQGRAIRFTQVNGVDLRLLMSMSSGELSPHSQVLGILSGAGAAATEGLTVTPRGGGDVIVSGSISSLFKAMAQSPKATFELDSPLAEENE